MWSALASTSCLVVFTRSLVVILMCLVIHLPMMKSDALGMAATLVVCLCAQGSFLRRLGRGLSGCGKLMLPGVGQLIWPGMELRVCLLGRSRHVGQLAGLKIGHPGGSGRLGSWSFYSW